MSRVSVHPVISLVTPYLLCRVLSIWFADGEGDSGSLVAWRWLAIQGVAHQVFVFVIASDNDSTSSIPGGVYKTCGSVPLATWSQQTCGSSCWQHGADRRVVLPVGNVELDDAWFIMLEAWSSSIKLLW